MEVQTAGYTQEQEGRIRLSLCSLDKKDSSRWNQD